MDDRQALETAARLEQLGVLVKSPELLAAAERHRHFAEHGNRAMRRAAARARRRKGGR